MDENVRSKKYNAIIRTTGKISLPIVFFSLLCRRRRRRPLRRWNPMLASQFPLNVGRKESSLNDARVKLQNDLGRLRIGT